MTIKEVRKKAKLSQKALAQLLSVSRTTVSYWECGDREMSLNLSQIRVFEEILKQHNLSFSDLAPTSADRHKKPLPPRAKSKL